MSKLNITKIESFQKWLEWFKKEHLKIVRKPYTWFNKNEDLNSLK